MEGRERENERGNPIVRQRAKERERKKRGRKHNLPLSVLHGQIIYITRTSPASQVREAWTLNHS